MTSNFWSYGRVLSKRFGRLENVSWRRLWYRWLPTGYVAWSSVLACNLSLMSSIFHYGLYQLLRGLSDRPSRKSHITFKYVSPGFQNSTNCVMIFTVSTHCVLGMPDMSWNLCCAKKLPDDLSSIRAFVTHKLTSCSLIFILVFYRIVTNGFCPDTTVIHYRIY